MATEAEDLAEIRANYLAQWKELSANPRPNYSIGGRSVSWQQYSEFLAAQLALLGLDVSGGDDGVLTATAIE